MATYKSEINIKNASGTYDTILPRTTYDMVETSDGSKLSDVRINGNELKGEIQIQGKTGSAGVDGRQIELRKTQTHIEWKYMNELSPLADFTSTKTVVPVFNDDMIDTLRLTGIPKETKYAQIKTVTISGVNVSGEPVANINPSVTAPSGTKFEYLSGFDPTNGVIDITNNQEIMGDMLINEVINNSVSQFPSELNVVGIDKIMLWVYALDSNKSELAQTYVTFDIKKTTTGTDDSWKTLISLDELKGEKGNSATIKVGSVSTGEAGTEVIITNSGTENDAVFNFTIPRGEQGIQGVQGQQGIQGIQGENGRTSTITVGTVTTGEPESSVSITNVGTSTDAIFDFTIPRGKEGKTIVPNITANATTLPAGSNVTVEKSGTNTDVAFTFGIPKGDKGEQGDKGLQGIQGIQGVAGKDATISVGTVTTGVAGSNASVTNVGTPNNAIFNFTIPRGDAIKNEFVSGDGVNILDNVISAKLSTDIDNILKVGKDKGLYVPTASGKKYARVVIGNSTTDYRDIDVDYLCDGVNDQIEIQKAIDSLPSGGGEIIVLDGTYNLSANINVNKNNINITGCGNNTIFKNGSTNYIFVVSGESCVLSDFYCKIEYLSEIGIQVNAPYNKIERVRVDRSDESSSSSRTTGIILLDKATGSVITNSIFKNNNNGVRSNAVSCIISNNVFVSDRTGYGTNISGVITYNGDRISNNTVFGNIFKNLNTGVNPGIGTVVSNNIFDFDLSSNDSVGVRFSKDSLKISVLNNMFSNCYTGIFMYRNYYVTSCNNCFIGNYYAIHSKTSSNTLIQSNIINGSTNIAIYFESGGSNCNISNNVIDRTNYSNIQLLNLMNSIIGNNIINRNNYYGIYLANNANNNNIIGNSISNNQTSQQGIYLANSNNNLVSGNISSGGKEIVDAGSINNTIVNNKVVQ